MESLTPPGSSPRPKALGPARRWLVLLAWVLCLTGVLAAQRLTAGTFPTGHWAPEGPTPPTAPEMLWYLLSPAMILVFGRTFFLASRRLVPEPITRKEILILGCTITLVALLASMGLGCCFNFMWRVD